MCLNFSQLQSTLHLMQYNYWDFFSTAQNNFLSCQFWCLLVLLSFCFTSSTPAKHSLRGPFSSEETNKQKSRLGRDQVNREGGAHGSCHFWSKTTEHSVVWTGALVNHPPWNGQTRWKGLQINSLKPNSASHNNASWYSDTDGFQNTQLAGEACTTKGPFSRR